MSLLEQYEYPKLGDADGLDRVESLESLFMLLVTATCNDRSEKDLQTNGSPKDPKRVSAPVDGVSTSLVLAV
jgi:hypothetical protein